MSKNDQAIASLRATLNRRASTQTVARHILELDIASQFPATLTRQLETVAAEPNHGMREDFAPVDDATSQLTTLKILFPDVDSINGALNLDGYHSAYLANLQAVANDLHRWLNIPIGVPAQEVLASRISDKVDWSASQATSKKAYLKRLRALASFEFKIARVKKEIISRTGLMTAKSRLARHVAADKLNDFALAYVAYVTARANRRTRFQLSTQSRAFDEAVDQLFKLLPSDTAWNEVVLVSPVESLFRKLSPKELGNAIALFHHEMVFWVTQLEKEWDSLPEDVQNSGVVRRGTNSTDFNSYAGAYNTMRSAWIAAMSTAGLKVTFDQYLPGKAVRLLAADLVRWNSIAGEPVSKDFSLFHKLPYPWLVVSGQQTLNRQQMVDADVFSEKALAETGWVSPRSGLEFEVPEPDPALVHGVTVSDPNLAEVLRKIGVFSAKPLNLSVLQK